jgi:endoglucanase
MLKADSQTHARIVMSMLSVVPISMQPAPSGVMVGGPTTDTSYWDPYLTSLYPDKDCAPQFCYVDDLRAWSVGEIGIDGNSSLAWLAWFLADQAHAGE